MAQQTYTAADDCGTYYNAPPLYDLSHVNDGDLTSGVIWNFGSPYLVQMTMTFHAPVTLTSVKVQGGQYNGAGNIPGLMKLYRGTVSGGTLLLTISPTSTLDTYTFPNSTADTLYTWLIDQSGGGGNIYASVIEIQAFGEALAARPYTAVDTLGTYYNKPPLYGLPHVNDGVLTDGVVWQAPSSGYVFEMGMIFPGPIVLTSVKVQAGQYNGALNGPLLMKLYRGTTTTGTLLLTIPTPSYSMTKYDFANTGADDTYTWEITGSGAGVYISVIEIQAFDQANPQLLYTPTDNLGSYDSTNTLDKINDGDLTSGVIWTTATSPIELTLTFDRPIQITSISVQCGQYNGNFHQPSFLQLYRGTVSGGTLLTSIGPVYPLTNYPVVNSGFDTIYTCRLGSDGTGTISIIELEAFGLTPVYSSGGAGRCSVANTFAASSAGRASVLNSWITEAAGRCRVAFVSRSTSAVGRCAVSNNFNAAGSGRASVKGVFNLVGLGRARVANDWMAEGAGTARVGWSGRLIN